MRTYILSLLAGTAAAALVASAASAADLPARAAPPAPFVPAVPIFTWTGFYAGVNAGAAWNTNSNNTVFVPGVGFVDNGGGNDAGFAGGGQLGYNYQIGSFVIGVETDIQWADLGGGNNDIFVPGVGFVSGNGNSLDWFGTVRARAGVAFDRVLIYATGGFAYGSGGSNGTCFVGTTIVACNNNDTNTGWTVGGGVEWALPVNWLGSSAVTFGVEGLYVNLDQNNNNNNFFNGVAFDNNNNNMEFGVVRAKLNFKFGTY